MGRPWSGRLENFNLTITAELNKTSELTERCVHTIRKPEEEDQLLNIQFDWQRVFTDGWQITKENLELLRERERLLMKKFEGTITRKESNRLEYVRWSLDRIDDARHGQGLEALESAVSRYEDVLTGLRSLGLQLEERLPSSRKRR